MRTGTTIGVGLVGDQAGAVIDLHQAAGDGDAAFREDDQRARRPCTALISVRVAIGLRRIERHRAGEAQERLHPPLLRDARRRWRTPARVSQQRQRQRRRRGSSRG